MYIYRRNFIIVIAFPNFKINIGLHITKKREDGFHDLQTIFYPIDNKTDKIVVSAGHKFIFTMEGADFNTKEADNICVKAFQLLQKKYKLGQICIELTKNIPSGAGLGGGSSDAATILKMVNELYNLNITRNELINYASLLGSDVPFFIDNKPAYATGKGEMLSPVELDLGHKKISVFKPSFSISTAEAYAAVIPHDNCPYLPDLCKLPVAEWKNCVVNDFENALFPRYPVLNEIKNKFYESGADYAALSGSGSALFAIADFPIDLSPIFEGINI